MASEPEGFRDYVAGRQRALLRTVWLLTADWQQAEDLVQTTLVRVWPHWERVSSGPCAGLTPQTTFRGRSYDVSPSPGMTSAVLSVGEQLTLTASGTCADQVDYGNHGSGDDAAPVLGAPGAAWTAWALPCRRRLRPVERSRT